VLVSASVAYKLKRELQVDLAFGGRSAGSTLPHRFVTGGFTARF
jgi:hypothetical protein